MSCASVLQALHASPLLHAHPLGSLAAGLASGLASGAAKKGADVVSKAVATELLKQVPTYPTATDYASGVCAGEWV